MYVQMSGYEMGFEHAAAINDKFAELSGTIVMYSQAEDQLVKSPYRKLFIGLSHAHCAST